MNRKGIVFTRPRDTVSFFVGLFLFAVGFLPLIGSGGVVKILPFGLPAFLTSLIAGIAIWLIAIAGLYIVVDGFIEPPAHNLHWILIACGIVLFVIGFLPLLNKFGVIGFGIPFLSNMFVYQGLIGLEGLLLMIGGLTEH